MYLHNGPAAAWRA